MSQVLRSEAQFSRCRTLFSELLAEVLGVSVFDSPPECDRAHCTLSNKPGPGQRPGPVVIRLHRFQQKDKIIREARAKRGKLQYRGTPIAIYEDYPSDSGAAQGIPRGDV